jgi:hypothetical protein
MKVEILSEKPGAREGFLAKNRAYFHPKNREIVMSFICSFSITCKFPEDPGFLGDQSPA